MAAKVPAPACDARIVVTGAGTSAGAARALLRAELRDVRYAEFTGDDAAPPAECFADVDMLVFVAAAGDAADAARTAAVAEAARSQGTLVSAVIVARDVLADDAPLLATLREAADNVMIVRDAASVPAILRALR